MLTRVVNQKCNLVCKSFSTLSVFEILKLIEIQAYHFIFFFFSLFIQDLIEQHVQWWSGAHLMIIYRFPFYFGVRERMDVIGCIHDVCVIIKVTVLWIIA